MPQTYVMPRQLAISSANQLLSGALLYFYQTGTTTPQAVYSDAAYSVELPNPVPALASGEFPKIYPNPNAEADYRVRYTTAAGVLIYQEDDISRYPASQSEIGAALYPRTDAERVADVTPVSYVEPTLYSPRYANLGDLIATLGSTGTMHGGRSVLKSGTQSLTGTVTIDRKTGVFIGDGPGSESAGDGTCLVWEGSAGQPMLQIKRCWAATFEQIRFKGNSSAKPSAAILLTSTLAESPVNTAMAFEHLWIGTYGAFDTDNAIQFVDGFVVDGANLQGDQSQIKHITVQGVTTSCIAFRQTQNTLWSIETATLNSGTYGIEYRSRHLTAKNIFCQTISAADYYMPTDSSMTVEGFGSELGGRLCYALDGFDFTFRRGYFQAATASVTVSGRIVDLTSTGIGSVTFEDVLFYTVGGYSGPTLKFYARGTKLLIKLKNVSLPSAIDTFLDLATVNSGDSRHVILENVIDSTGAVFNGNFYWVHGDYAPTFSTDALGQQHRPVLTASTTVDPASLIAGAITGATVAFSGARLGDYVEASFTQDLSGIILNAWVSSTDNVKYNFYNPTAGTLDLSSGTLRLRVMKF
jgi:hypothetical protein